MKNRIIERLSLSTKLQTQRQNEILQLAILPPQLQRLLTEKQQNKVQNSLNLVKMRPKAPFMVIRQEQKLPHIVAKRNMFQRKKNYISFGFEHSKSPPKRVQSQYLQQISENFRMRDYYLGDGHIVTSVKKRAESKKQKVINYDKFSFMAKKE